MKKVALFLVIAILVALSAWCFLLPSLDLSIPIPEFKWPNGGSSAKEPDVSAPAASGSAGLPSPEAFAPVGSHPADGRISMMTLEEKVGQMFFARCPDREAVETVQNLHPGGYILFSRDFEGKTPADVKQILASYQAVSKIPLLIGVDEEGGEVVRVSKHTAFRRWPFQSPQELFEEGGMDAFVPDTVEKDKLLKGLGINVNLAPVCDVSTSKSDYMYKRTLGQDADATADYIQLVVRQMTKDGMGAVLKHFPGYGPNGDTHAGAVTDKREIETFMNNDFLPFIAGIEAGAGSVLVSHNIVTCMDDTHPASLSPEVNSVLRNTLDFGGVAMTDDLAMDAVAEYADLAAAPVQAILAGNDMLITSDLQAQYNAVLEAVRGGVISENQINEAVRRILTWKDALGLIELEG